MTIVRRFAELLGALLMVVSTGVASGPTPSITGQIQNATGGTVNYGTLSLTLSQPAIVGGTTTLATRSSSCYTSAQGNVVGIPDPVVPPLLSVSTSSGSLASGTYYAKIYYTNPDGWVSAVSPEASISLNSSGTLMVKAPAYQPSGASGYGVAIATTSGAETVQDTVTGWTSYQQSSALTAGSSPASINSSSCHIYFSDQLIPTGTYYTVNLLNGSGSQVAGFPQLWCTYGGAGATINISHGAPAVCNRGGVYYPTPILTTQDGSSIPSVYPKVTSAGLNGRTLVDGKKYPCTAMGINNTIKEAAERTGSIVFVSPSCTGITIGSNLWSGVSAPSKVIFGPGTFIFNAQQILPSHTEVSCSGWQTTLSISTSLNISIAWGSGLFSNSANPVLGGTGTDTGISIHDCVLDGTGNAQITAGITLYNASDSRIVNMYLNNIFFSGIDIRNGSNNEVRDSWCVNCAAVGAPQHAIGGGIVGQTDSFLDNKFVRNHVFGGGSGNGGADHFDIFGQASRGHCGFNIFVGNTSDFAPSEGIFLDTCNHDVVSQNIVRSAGKIGIACTSGIHNLDGGCSYNLFSGNKILSAGQSGHYFNNNADENTITAEEIWKSGEEAIRINDSGRNKIENLLIYSPSLSSTHPHCAVTINSDTAGAYSSQNTVQENVVYDPDDRQLSGVCLTSAGGPTYVSNNIVQGNHINDETSVTYGKRVAENGNNDPASFKATAASGNTYKYAIKATTQRAKPGIFIEVRGVGGCTTRGTAGSNCATPVTVNWPESLVDTNYFAACTPRGAPTNDPSAPYVVSASKSVSSMQVNYIAMSSGPAKWDELDCWAIVGLNALSVK